MDLINLLKFTLSIIIYLILSPILITILFINEIRWNGGVCRKCNSDRYELYFRPDKFINHHYFCNKCNHRFLSTRHRISPSDKELKSMIRNNKINKII